MSPLGPGPSGDKNKVVMFILGNFFHDDSLVLKRLDDYSCKIHEFSTSLSYDDSTTFSSNILNERRDSFREIMEVADSFFSGDQSLENRFDLKIRDLTLDPLVLRFIEVTFGLLEKITSGEIFDSLIPIPQNKRVLWLEVDSKKNKQQGHLSKL